ncbi:hypothetical protein [Chitinophaga sp.]|uniref:hypothetical protein n=1 Tax=Chitinophaga sp. TaxID=1869181 RepID=UPI002BDBC1A4|nr:hypothetical protein [Chitinophaga sp.]HWV67165.1 hypothetical protein [Chitinophaga sp.]
MLLALHPLTSKGQQFPQADQLATALTEAAAAVPAGNIYLQTDRGVYEPGEDLWFNARLLNAQHFVWYTPDQTLYVKLTRASSDSTVWQQLYPISNGASSGHIYLDGNLTEGDYWLKAYAAHSFMRGPAPFYALRKVRIIKDSYSLPRSSGSIALRPGANDSIKLQTFPEGGTFITGLKNRIAFKATGGNGAPVYVTGMLLKNGKPLQRIETTHLGMGSFDLTPQQGATYTIQLANSFIALPKPADTGIVMHVRSAGADSLALKITASPGMVAQRIYISSQVRGLMQAAATALLTDSLLVKLPVAQGPGGITAITLFDQQLQPLAKRLVFVLPDKKLNIGLQLHEEHYSTREKVSLTISTKNEQGIPVPARLSLSVFYNAYSNNNDKNIENHYLLTSQLKARIDDPGYYFDGKNKDRLAALDLLLLTQEHDSYLWNNQRQPGVDTRPVITDSIAGSISFRGRRNNSHPSPNLLFVFNAEEKNNTLLSTDSTGRFFLDPAILATGNRLYIKYPGQSRQPFTITIADPFAAITAAEKNKTLYYPPSLKRIQVPDTAVIFSRFSKTLAGVEISAKGAKTTWPKYLGKLDSLAKLEGPADYVGACGLLNCPACGGGTKPVEGKEYSEYIGNRRQEIASHPFAFTAGEMKKVKYHYPVYTEEQLLKKFNLAVAGGYYVSPQFNESGGSPDFRKTIAWMPDIVTDEHGEATVSFYCSDVYGRFQVSVEGVSEQGLMGKGVVEVEVSK